MTAVELLRLQSAAAYSELRNAIQDLTEQQAWAILPPAADDYLNTDGSVQGMVLHVATGKFMYAGAAFRPGEIRWRDLAARLDEFEPSWAAAADYLEEAQAYWLDAWSGLSDSDLSVERGHFSGSNWPTWKIIHTVTAHDSYHAGQVAVIRYATANAEVPPPRYAEDIRTYCRDLPTW